MSFKLVVVHDFHGYPKGSVITDQAEVGSMLAGEHEGRVVKVTMTDAEVAEMTPQSAPMSTSKAVKAVTQTDTFEAK